MKDTFRHAAIAVGLGWSALMTGCSTTSQEAAGSLQQIQREQRAELFMACSTYVFEQDLHKLMNATVLAEACRDWADARFGSARRALVMMSERNGFVRR